MAIQEINIRSYFSIASNLEAFHALCEANRSEVEGLYGQKITPNWDAYAALQDSGNLIALGVFDCGEMVGYGCAVIAPSLHYGHISATNDVIFILPEYRKKGYGLRLMRDMERMAKDKGAQFMVWQAKAGSSLNRVLERMGCRMEEISYVKELKNGV